MEGWIKLHRKFIEWEWFDDTEAVKLFLYLLLSANHKDGKWRGIDVKRGQLITGLNSLSEKLNMSVKVIRNRLDKLEKTGELVRQTGNQYSIITVCKYDDYQSKDEEEGKQEGRRRASKGQAKGKRRATNKNVNNDEDANEDVVISKNSTIEENIIQYKQWKSESSNDTYKAFIDWLIEREPKVCLSLGDQITEGKFSDLMNMDGATKEKLKIKIMNIEGWRDNKKYKHFYAVLKNWMS